MDLLDQMATFVRIVDTGKIGAAAKSRGMSPAAVSRQLSALEQDLGTVLIARSTRELAITDSGQRWYRYCVKALSELETARADVDGAGTAKGTMVISAPASLGVTFLVEELEQASRRYPDLVVELRLEDHSVNLLGDGVDVAIRVGVAPPDSASFVAHRLATFRRALVATPGYLRKNGVPKHPNDLADHALLVHSRAAASFTRWEFSRGDEKIEIYPRSRLLSSSPIALREWARKGAGIALIPDWYAAELKPVLTDWLTPTLAAYALYRSDARRTTRMQIMLETLTGAMAGVGAAQQSR